MYLPVEVSFWSWHYMGGYGLACVRRLLCRVYWYIIALNPWRWLSACLRRFTPMAANGKKSYVVNTLRSPERASLITPRHLGRRAIVRTYVCAAIEHLRTPVTPICSSQHWLQECAVSFSGFFCHVVMSYHVISCHAMSCFLPPFHPALLIACLLHGMCLSRGVCVLCFLCCFDINMLWLLWLWLWLW